MSENDHNMPDAQQLKEILSTVSTEIPKLIEAISKGLLNAENAAQMGKTIAQFYSELVKAGMTPDKAYQLTRDYMRNFSIAGIMSSAIESGKKEESND